METVDRYLSAVRSMLPQKDQDDIVAELSEEIRAQVEDREAELGRPLTSEEQEAILAGYGHPMIVAGRYQKPEGSLVFGSYEIVGPELFPFYLKVLKVVIGLSAVVAFITFATEVDRNILRTFFDQIVLNFFFATATFAGIQAYIRRHPEGWDTSKPTPAAADSESPTSVRFGAVVEFVVTAFVLSLAARWLGAEPIHIGTGQTAPVWNDIFWPVMFAGFLGLGAMILTFLWPERRRNFAPIRIIDTFIWAVAFTYVAANGPWVIARPDVAPGRDLAFFNDTIARWVLISAVAITSLCVLWDLWSWIKKERQRPTANES